MSVAILLSAFVLVNALVAVAAVTAAALARANRRWRFLRHGDLLGWHYATLALVFAAGAARLVWPAAPLPRPAAQIWSSPSLREFAAEPAVAPRPLGVTILDRATTLPAASDTRLILAMAALALVVGAAKSAGAWRGIRRLTRGAWRVRRIGRVHVLASDRIAVPCTYWVPGRRVVVLPESILPHAAHMRAALAHELQHHRQGDARAVYGFAALALVCPFNPFASWWAREAADAQEFACDEALVDRRAVSASAYAACLLWVAETAAAMSPRPSRAPGLAAMADRHTLIRRIDIMLQSSVSSPRRRRHGLAVAALAFAAMGGVAFAARSAVEDRRVTWEEAKAMVGDAATDAEFPVTLNEAVLAQLNRYLGTPEGRAEVRDALERKKAYDALFAERFKAHDAPAALAAIPLVESAYVNRTPTAKPQWGAGLWMFIKSTARAHGLVVDKTKDERLDPRKETDAALRLLKAQKRAFGTWELAIMAYNMGENHVRRGIAAVGSRDPWRLVAAGFENDKDYLARVMAAAIILRNPDLRL